MADDQVKYSELIVDDNKGFESLIKALVNVKEELGKVQEAATTLTGSMKAISSATQQQQQQIAADAAAVEGLRRKSKELTEQQDQLQSAVRKFSNLTEEEAKQIEFLAKSLGYLNQNGTKNMNVWKNMTQSMNGFNMSYNQMKATVQVLEQALKSLTTEQQKNSDGAKSAAAAVVRLKEAMKTFDATTRTAVKSSGEYKKLTDAEVASINALKAALAGTTQEQIAAVQAIDVQSKSYNELYQIHKALTESLNAMSVAERHNTEAGSAMTEKAREAYETLNQLQQSVGKYTMNVGNYASAMNGLQFQAQQVLREIPSAQNLSQFFLAISNNIPMAADAMARYKAELPKIREELDKVTKEIDKQRGLLSTLTEGSAEYESKQEAINNLLRQQNELQKLNVSPAKAVLNVFKGWQFWLLAGLLLLRFMPKIIDSIVSKWKEWRHGVQLVTNEMNVMTAKAQVYSDVIKKTNDEVVKLDMVVERLKNVEKGTQEWKDGVAMVNDITKQNLDAVKTTKEEIEKVTEAYKEQAIQIATNDIIAEKVAKSRAQKALVKAALEADTLEAAMELAGYNADSKKGRKFAEAWQKYNISRNVNRQIDMSSEPGEWMKLPEIQSDLQVPPSPIQVESPEIGDKERIVLENMIRQQYQDMIDDEAENILQQMIKPVKPLKKERTSKGRQRQPSGSFNNSYDDVTMADVLVEEANAMSDKGDTVLQTIQMWYDKRVAITNAAYEKEKETLAKEREERNKSLTDNLLKAEQFKSKYDALVAEVDKDPYLDDEGKAARKAELKNQLDEATKLIESESVQRENIKKYYDERELIAEQKKQNELADIEKQRTEKLFKEEERRFKARQDADKRRFDLEKHNSIEQAKFNMEQEIASKQWQIDHAKELQLSEEQLAILKEEVEWLNKKYNQGNYNAKRGNTGNYSNIMDVLFGEKITNDQISAINSVFDQAKEALNSWMDARKAAADQAKELADDEVSAAENALNREIELRNQGYANNVALRERELADAKEKQKQAMEEQKKAAQEQILLDACMAASNSTCSLAIFCCSMAASFCAFLASANSRSRRATSLA